MIRRLRNGIIAAPHPSPATNQNETRLLNDAPVRFVILLTVLWLGGCATAEQRDPRDPLEPFNRGVHAFNEDVDRKVLRPVAETYQEKVPSPIRTGVSNFFSNLDDVLVLVNDLLQFKLEQSASDFLRLTTNTVFGLGGLIDVATPMGLPKHQEDFGQTLGTWGVGSGPYLVLPFLGPSTFRDTTGIAATWQADPTLNVSDTGTQAGLVGLRVVDTRAGLLQASRLLDQAALDPYAFMRDSYLQHRRNRIYDGNPPLERFDDFEDDFRLEDDDFRLEDDSAPGPEAPNAAPGEAAPLN